MPTESRLLLIADEDCQTREPYRAVLESAGYRVGIAADHATALARVAAGATDLVLLVLPVPTAQDLEFCSQIRARQGTIHLPIIVLASAPVRSAAAREVLAVADEYLPLPVQAADLLDRVHLWLWIRQRLRATETNAWCELTQEHLLDHYSWRERCAQDAAALAMARTVSDQLHQPLTALQGWLELWQDTGFGEETPEFWYAKFRAATDSLAHRIDALSRIVRFEPRDRDGQVEVDVVRGQMLRADRGKQIEL
jgi:CheY-like chemotaxis protein